MFYNGKINTKRHYAILKGKKIDYGPKNINVLYKLEQIVVGQPSFKEPSDRDMQDALDTVAWSDTTWGVTPIEKYHLFQCNLKIVKSVWLVFIKKKLIPTCHDSTISIERIMLL